MDSYNRIGLVLEPLEAPAVSDTGTLAVECHTVLVDIPVVHEDNRN